MSDTRAQQIESLKRLLAQFAGRFVELEIGLPGNEFSPLVPAAIKGIATPNEVALAFVVLTEGWGSVQQKLRRFSFDRATFDAEDAIWTLYSPSGLVCRVEEAMAASAGAPALAILKGDPDGVAEARVALRRYVAREGREVSIEPRRKEAPDRPAAPPRPRGTRGSAVNRYTATVARRMRSQVHYDPWFVVLVTPEGALVVVTENADVAEIAGVERDLYALLRSFDEPEAVLAYLYDRNSTVTAYSKPVVLMAESPEAAARKLIDREEGPAA